MSFRIGVVLAGSLALNLNIGSLYAFSMLIAPLQAAADLSRNEASLAFSIASGAFMIAMLAAARVQSLLPAPPLAALVGLLAALGLALPAINPSASFLYAGYGFLFGVANGLGYSLALQMALNVWTQRPGFATGFAISAYAMGGVVWAHLAAVLTPFGLATTLASMAAAAGLSGILAAAAYQVAGVALAKRPQTSERLGRPPMWFVGLWLGFFLGASAGLMALGHAAAIIIAAGGTAQTAAAGAMAVNIGNALGRIGAAWLSDIVGARRILIVVPMTMALALLALAGGESAWLLVFVIGVVGLCYGALATAYPAALAQLRGIDAVSRLYGRLFTAWGAAALAGPSVAGFGFDLSGAYSSTLIIASIAALLSAVACWSLPRRLRTLDTAGY